MVKVQDSDSYGLKRLESKNARNAIIQKLAVDFNLTPLITEAYYQQFSTYFQEHANQSEHDQDILDMELTFLLALQNRHYKAYTKDALLDSDLSSPEGFSFLSSWSCRQLQENGTY